MSRTERVRRQREQRAYLRWLNRGTFVANGRVEQFPPCLRAPKSAAHICAMQAPLHGGDYMSHEEIRAMRVTPINWRQSIHRDVAAAMAKRDEKARAA